FPEPFVLHSKFIMTDPDEPGRHPLCMFGSSNMDMRSFGLNYESTMLVAKGNLLAEFNQLASNYRAVCHELTLEEWNERGFVRRYMDNVIIPRAFRAAFEVHHDGPRRAGPPPAVHVRLLEYG
ncbi:hypothetical protein HT105_22715, partial [Bacteroides fragilis]|nr:hypothetical protein [Bacteroides fragilis]